MIIRSIKKSDIDSLSALAQKTYSETFGETMTKDELKSALNERSKEYFYSVYEKDIILVAIEFGQIIGFIQFGEANYPNIPKVKHNLALKKIYIDSKKQGQGIGKQLMEAMFQHKRTKESHNIFLDVYSKNEKALGLYKKFGFQEIGNIPWNVVGKITGDILMKKTVSDCKSIPEK